MLCARANLTPQHACCSSNSAWIFSPSILLPVGLVIQKSECATHARGVGFLRAGDLFLKMLRRMKQQWACEVSRGPDLAVDLSFLLTGPDVTLGPPLTSLDEGMNDDVIDVGAGEASASGAGSRQEHSAGAEEGHRNGSRAAEEGEAQEEGSWGYAAGGSGRAGEQQHRDMERGPRLSSAGSREAPVGG